MANRAYAQKSITGKPSPSETKTPSRSFRSTVRPFTSHDHALQKKQAEGGSAGHDFSRVLVKRQEQPMQPRMTTAGLPRTLQSGIERLAGIPMDDVNVHYNSPEPSRMHARAYTRGTDIHLGHGQEKHLPHEAWHVVQQKQQRVRPTNRLNGLPLNDDPALEREADRMGKQVSQIGGPREGSERESMRGERPGGDAPSGNRSSAHPVQMIKNIAPGTYVKVKTNRGEWYGYVDSATNNGYVVVVGGTSRGWGKKDKDAMKVEVPEKDVFLHDGTKQSLGLHHDNDQELSKDDVNVLKGRQYKRMTSNAVESNWNDISDQERGKWDDAFNKDYRPNLEVDGLKPHQYQNRIGDIEFSKTFNDLVRKKDRKGLEEFYDKHEEMLKYAGDKQTWVGLALQHQAPQSDDAIYDKDQSFKVGWRGSVVDNARRRNNKETHGEYTGRVNLAKGEFWAEGSYRNNDSLNQNEIIYQIWREAHEANGLDITKHAQRKPLKRIVRNHVVNEVTQPIIDKLKNGKHTVILKPGSKDFDILLTTPNVRSVLFLVKDRGRELGIKGIKQITLKGVDAIIEFAQA